MSEKARRPVQASVRPCLFDSEHISSYDGRMCIICIDFNRGALRPAEARRALNELRDSLPAEHVREIERTLRDAGEDVQPPAAGKKP